MFEGVSYYDFPEIKPVNIDVENSQMLGFNYALTEKNPKDKILHFFLDDYQFERVWNNADKYLGVLRNFKAVCSPDFSLYLDFPRTIQLYNNYRRQWCGAYWQDYGITVIPTVRWADEESFDWCFEGIPKKSLVCISTVGGFREKAVEQAWMKGYHKALEVLDPSHILFYGKVHKQIDIPCPYTQVLNQNTVDREEASKKLNSDVM